MTWKRWISVARLCVVVPAYLICACIIPGFLLALMLKLASMP